MIKALLFGLFIVAIVPVKAQFSLSDSGASVGYAIKNCKTGELISATHSKQRLISASLLKIVTTSTALEVLGPDYTFKTDIGYNGTIEDGVLNGNIVIKAGYDPTVGSEFFVSTNPENVLQNIVEKIKEAGIVKITGKIQIQSVSKEIPFSSPRLWEDMGNYYGGIPHSFNWRDNTSLVTLCSGDVGDTCKIKRVFPEFEPYHLNSYVIGATHNKDSAYVYGTKDIKDWWMEGSIPANRNEFPVKAAMPDPGLIFVNELNEKLIATDIPVLNQQIVDPSEQISRLCRIESPVLAEIIKVTNHKSNNLFADALLLAMGKEKTGVVSWEAGLNVVSDFWAQKIDFKNDFRMKDGSGLSPKNLVTTNGMTDILLWMEHYSKSFDIFKASLAVGGESGTLKSVFKSKGLKGNVLGKSGSMEGVLGYCGYMNTKDGKNLVFCIIANNFLLPFKDVRTEMDIFISSFYINN